MGNHKVVDNTDPLIITNETGVQMENREGGYV